MDERPPVTSPSNPLIRQVRALRGHKARVERGLFLVEGIHHVGSALEAGWDVQTLVYAPDLLTGEFASSLLAGAQRNQLELQPVSVTVMESLAEKDHPQGILAVVKQKTTRLSDLHAFQCGAALVSPQDPGNIGAILRTLDAVGADALFLLEGGVELFHPTVVRASMGTLFWKPVVQASFTDFLEWARAEGVRLVGASAHASLDYRAARPDVAPWALLLGSEQKGLSAGQIAACDEVVSLPMRGRVSSLNLAVAAGILLYAYNA